MKTKARIHKGIFTAMLCVAWESVASLDYFPKALFPSLKAIFTRWLQMLLNEHLLEKVAYSIIVVAISMLIALSLSVFLVSLFRPFPFVKHSCDLLSTIASPLPGVAILPLVILWFGIGQGSMLFILVHAMFWPLLNTLDLSLVRLHSTYHRFMNVYRINKKTRLIHIYIPGIKNDLLLGLSIAWGRGWRALISAEMIFGLSGHYSGLGWLIYERRMYMDTAGLYASIFTVALVGLVMEGTVFKRGGSHGGIH